MLSSEVAIGADEPPKWPAASSACLSCASAAGMSLRCHASRAWRTCSRHRSSTAALYSGSSSLAGGGSRSSTPGTETEGDSASVLRRVFTSAEAAAPAAIRAASRPEQRDSVRILDESASNLGGRQKEFVLQNRPFKMTTSEVLAQRARVPRSQSRGRESGAARTQAFLDVGRVPRISRRKVAWPC